MKSVEKITLPPQGGHLGTIIPLDRARIRKTVPLEGARG